MMELMGYIANTLLDEYEVLGKCKFVKDDGIYIYYKGYLSFDLRNILNYELLVKIYNYCEENNCTELFKENNIYLVQDW